MPAVSASTSAQNNPSSWVGSTHSAPDRPISPTDPSPAVLSSTAPHSPHSPLPPPQSWQIMIQPQYPRSAGVSGVTPGSPLGSCHLFSPLVPPSPPCQPPIPGPWYAQPSRAQPFLLVPSALPSAPGTLSACRRAQSAVSGLAALSSAPGISQPPASRKSAWKTGNLILGLSPATEHDQSSGEGPVSLVSRGLPLASTIQVWGFRARPRRRGCWRAAG